MHIELAPGEKLLKKGAANLQRGWEMVGGRLYLTTRRLHFSSHALNVNQGAQDIPLSEVVAVRPGWTKLLGLLPLVPNQLRVQTEAGIFDFVVWGRASWKAAIEPHLHIGTAGHP